MINFTLGSPDSLTTESCTRIALEYSGIVAQADEHTKEQEAYFEEIAVENFGFKWIPSEKEGMYKLILVPRNDETKPLIFKGRAIYAAKYVGCPLSWAIDYFTRVKGVRFSHELEVIRNVYEITQNPAIAKCWKTFPGPVYKIKIWLNGAGKKYKDVSHARLVSIDQIIKEFYT